jgi:alpha-tubulin suppressor-like RCC1 family protein
MNILFTFGLNEDGQCGHEEDGKIWYPLPVAFPERVLLRTISAGSRHTLALSKSGAVYSWGWGANGQLGLGMEVGASSPTHIPSLKNVTEISAGGMHSGCIDAQNHCYTWGSATCGQLGRPCESPHDAWPEKVIFPLGLVNASRIACGGLHTAVVDMSGNLFCWGKSDSGQTGQSNWYIQAYESNLSHITTPRGSIREKRSKSG